MSVFIPDCVVSLSHFKTLYHDFKFEHNALYKSYLALDLVWQQNKNL